RDREPQPSELGSTGVRSTDPSAQIADAGNSGRAPVQGRWPGARSLRLNEAARLQGDSPRSVLAPFEEPRSSAALQGFPPLSSESPLTRVAVCRLNSTSVVLVYNFRGRSARSGGSKLRPCAREASG